MFIADRSASLIAEYVPIKVSIYSAQFAMVDLNVACCLSFSVLYSVEDLRSCFYFAVSVRVGRRGLNVIYSNTSVVPRIGAP